jgi:hypothetical protein
MPATRMSDAQVQANPQPAAAPRIAAMMGCGMLRIFRMVFVNSFWNFPECYANFI